MNEIELQRPITPEELNKSLAQRDRPAPPKQSKEADTFRMIGKFVRQQVDAACKPLRERIAALEKKTENFRYCGVYATGLYHEMNVVTHDGSMWVCMRDTTQRPGLNGDWCLAVKRGKDGKDGKDGPRSATAARTYGVAS